MSTIETSQIIARGTADWDAVHPEIRAAAPAWADTVEAEDDGPHVAVTYGRSFGSVDLALAGHWENGTVNFTDHSPAFVYFSEVETGVTADDLRQFAAEFTAAADAMDASKPIRRAVDVDEHLRALDA